MKLLLLLQLTHFSPNSHRKRKNAFFTVYHYLSLLQFILTKMPINCNFFLLYLLSQQNSLFLSIVHFYLGYLQIVLRSNYWEQQKSPIFWGQNIFLLYNSIGRRMGNEIRSHESKEGTVIRKQPDLQSTTLLHDGTLVSSSPLHVYMHYRTSLPIRTLTDLKNTIQNKKQISSSSSPGYLNDKSPQNRMFKKRENPQQRLMNLKIVKTTTAKLKQNEAIFCGEAKLEEMFSSEHPGSKLPKDTSNKFKSITINIEEFLIVKQQSIEGYYEMKEKIGEGSFGQVFRATCKKTQEDRAIKVLKTRYMKQNRRRQFLTEMQLLSKLKHPSIIRLYDLFHHKHEYFVVMQYCQGGSIIDLLKKCERKSEKIIMDIMKQLFSALTYMHSLDIVHRDIKLDNIVFIDHIENEIEEPISIKIIDFGTAVHSKHKIIQNFPVTGTLSYLAPQVLKGILTEKSDIWSSAVLLVILLTGISYFKGKHQHETTSNILNKKINFEQEPLRSLSNEAKNLLNKMLDRNYAKRIDASDVLKHPWFSISKQHRNSVNLSNLQQLQSYYRGNNLISVIESYLSLKKVNQQERQELANLFNQIDSDGNGMIDVSEFVGIYKTNFSAYSEQEIKVMVESMDKNKSGKIDFNEFIIAMYSREKLFITESLNEAFQYFDKDHTGYIEKNELKELLKGGQLEEIEYFINELDIDGDAKISRKEFIDYLITFGQKDSEFS